MGQSGLAAQRMWAPRLVGTGKGEAGWTQAQDLRAPTPIPVLLLQFICCLALKICHRVCNGNTSVIACIIWIIDLQQWNCWSNCPFIWKITTWQDHIRPFYSVSSSKCPCVISCWATNLCTGLPAAPSGIKHRTRVRDCSVPITASCSSFV